MFHPKGPTLLELARQALSSTDDGYDLLAPKFEYTPFCTPDWVLETVAPRIGRIDRAIDLCCGTGAALRMLRPRCEIELVGVDRSQGMLDEARRKLERVDGSPFRLIQGDVLDLSLGHQFDVATCFGAFGHILEKDEPRFVGAIRDVLVPGGRFIFVTSDTPSNLSPAVWIARSFNGVMRIRNALWKPEFVMYYLTFLLPRATALLDAIGFDVDTDTNIFGSRAPNLVLVTATKR